jgi:hypothetical protein
MVERVVPYNSQESEKMAGLISKHAPLSLSWHRNGKESEWFRKGTVAEWSAARAQENMGPGSVLLGISHERRKYP